MVFLQAYAMAPEVQVQVQYYVDTPKVQSGSITLDQPLVIQYVNNPSYNPYAVPANTPVATPVPIPLVTAPAVNLLPLTNVPPVIISNLGAGNVQSGTIIPPTTNTVPVVDPLPTTPTTTNVTTSTNDNSKYILIGGAVLFYLLFLN